MDVGVEDALPSSCTHVKTHVVAVGTEFVVKYLALTRHQFHTGGDLCRRKIEEAGAVPERHDQGMTRADGVAVARAVGQRVTPRHPAWCAEQTRVVRVTHT